MSVRDVMIAAGSPGVNPGAKWVTRNVLRADSDSYAPDRIYGISYGNGKYLVFGDTYYTTNGEVILSSTDLSAWTQSAAIPTANYIRDVVYGNGVYVAIGSSTTPNGGIYTSTDAITWTERLAPSDWDGQQPLHIVFTGSIFVIISIECDCATSVNGTSWANQSQLQTAIGVTTPIKLMWTGSNIIAVRQSDAYMAVSSNGVTWSGSSTLRNFMLSIIGSSQPSVIANNGNVIIGYSGTSFTFGSQNGGVSWDRLVNLSGVGGGMVTAPAGLAVYGSGYVLADTNSGYIYAPNAFPISPGVYYIIQGYPYTFLGTDFNAYPYIPEQKTLYDVRYIASPTYSGFFTFGAYGRLWQHSNMAAPTNKTLSLTKQDLYFTKIGAVRAFATDGTYVIAAGDYGRIAKGTEEDIAGGSNFALQSNTLNQAANWGSSADILAAIWTGSKYIVVGESGKVATSADGSTWTYQTGLSSTTWGTSNARVLVSNGTTILTAGSGGRVATTADGVTWTYQAGLSSTSWGTSIVNGAVWNGSFFLVVGESGKTATSTDGVTWTYSSGLSGTSWSTTTCLAVTWSSTLSLFVVVGASGKIATSTNGTSWTVRTSGISTSNSLYAIAYANGKFIAVGGASTPVVLYSEDGVSWNDKSRYLTSSWVYYVTCVAWLGTRFVVGGLYGQLSSSP